MYQVREPSVDREPLLGAVLLEDVVQLRDGDDPLDDVLPLSTSKVKRQFLSSSKSSRSSDV